MKSFLSSLRPRLILLLVVTSLGLGLAGCHEEHRRVVHHGYYDDRREVRHDHYYDRDAGYRRGYYSSGPTVVVRPGF